MKIGATTQCAPARLNAGIGAALKVVGFIAVLVALVLGSTAPAGAAVDAAEPLGVVLEPALPADGARTIAVDPGHGGPDPGAAQGQLVERDVNLQIAQRLATALQDQGFRVVLTRNSAAAVNPNYLEAGQRAEARRDLQDRIDVANGNAADLLVSIHNNASADPAERGAEVWYDSARSFADRNLALAQLVLQDVLRQLEGAGYSAFNRGVRDDSHFRVFRNRPFPLYLLGPGNTGFRPHQPSAMPGVLGETLFLTNAGDAWALQQPSMLQAIANGYRDAVVEYFKQNL